MREAFTSPTLLPAALALLIILLAAWLPGWLALRRLAPGAELTHLRLVERPFAALSLGLALLGWLSLLLAQLALFSLPLLTALWLLLTAALYTLTRRSRTPSLPDPHTAARPHPWLEPALLLLYLPAALWLFLRPHEAILGGADAGVYVSTAAHVARQGSILVHDPTLAQMDPALQAAVLRPIPGGATPAYLFPAFNVADAQTGAIIPDFFHLHPTWQALAYALGHWLGATPAAVRAALLMPGLWALLGALAFYLAVSQSLRLRLSKEREPPTSATLFSAAALVALSLNAIQVWFARYPVAETLSQYLLWTGLWAFGAWLSRRRPLRLWGLLAALSFGLLLLTRIDMVFILAIPILAAAWQLSGRQRRAALQRDVLWFYLPLGLLALHAALHTAFISRPYFHRIVGYGQQLLARYSPILAVAIPLALLAGLLIALLLRRGSALRRSRLRRPLLALAALTIFLLAAYAWFLRPVYGALPSYPEWYDGRTIVLTDRENLIRLSWYLSPLGVWLGVAGAMLMLWRAGRRTLPILGVGLFFSLLYLWRIQANPHQIYVMRRYVPAVLPFFVAAAAYLLHALLFVRSARFSARNGSSLSSRLGPILALLLTLAWLAATAWSARGFVTQVDYRGLTNQLAQLDRRLEPHSVLLFDDQSPITLGDSLGTPLRFVFGHDVYSLRAPQSLDDDVLVKSIESWHNNRRAVYWIGAPDWLQEQGFDYTSAQVTIATSTLEGSYDHKPYRIIPVTWTLNLNRVAPQPAIP